MWFFKRSQGRVQYCSAELATTAKSYTMISPHQSSVLCTLHRMGSANVYRPFFFLVSAVLAQVFLIEIAHGSSGDQIAEIPLVLTHQACVMSSDLYEASITELQDGLENGYYSSVDLVKVFCCWSRVAAVLNNIHQAYLSRIEEVNFKGPKLHAVLEVNPHALAQAAASDLERKTKGNHNLGSLHGIPILVKDNIATSGDEGKATFRCYYDI